MKDILLGDSSPKIGALLIALLLSLVVTFIARRAGFYTLPYKESRYPLSFLVPLGGFLIYLVLSLVFLPLAALALIYASKGTVADLKSLPPMWMGSLQIAAILIIFIALLIYCFRLKRETILEILWGEEKNRTFLSALKNIGMGFLSWFVCYPVVVFISVVASFFAFWIWGKSGIEQVAVKQLKMTQSHPALFSLMIVVLVVVVPMIEELLFRGFLQTWLRRHFGRSWAIPVTALIFSLLHYARSQGSGNFELLISLFFLSLYLGFLYERQTTLWAPIGLHMTFNAISVLAIVFAAS